jgi:cyclic-di-GMP phosphodiesterase TipF (flagellum assembly factor)
MSLIHHILFVVAYTLVAAVVAVGLPQMMPQVGQVPAVVFLAGSALLHEVFLRQEGENRLTERMHELQVDYDESRRRLNRVLERVDALQREVKLTKAQAVKGRDRNREVDSVIAEVKVLQGLIEQLSTAQQAPASDQAIASRKEPAAPRTAAEPDTVTGAVTGPMLPAAPDNVPEVATGLDDEAILKVVREGLSNNRVDLYLQPIVSLPQRKRKYYGPFTRIRDDHGGMVVPNQYIAIAEREGLITAIDNMLLFRCVQLVRKSQNDSQHLGFFCNISAHSLTDRHFFRNFVEFVATTRCWPPT